MSVTPPHGVFWFTQPRPHRYDHPGSLVTISVIFIGNSSYLDVQGERVGVVLLDSRVSGVGDGVVREVVDQNLVWYSEMS